MRDPTKSVLWTEIFMGNGQGVVYTGPFAEWRTPAENTYLRRDIPGPRSSLIDPIKIQNVLNKKFHRDILAPAAKRKDDIERHHDAVHRYVGGRDGHMGGLRTSPQDPVFFLHHCFIDYLWERFREGQDIDSATDYPATNDPFHQPNRVMDNLKPDMTMIEGYGDSFTTKIYKYALAPTCGKGCGGSFLYCYKGNCVSRSRKQFKDLNGFSQVDSEYVGRVASSVVGDVGINAASVGTPSLGTSNVLSGDSVGTSSSPNFRAALDIPMTSTNAAPRITGRFREGIVDARTSSRRRRSLSSPETHDTYDIKSGIQNIAAMPVTIVNEHSISLSFRSLKNNVFQENYQNSKLFNIEIETVGFTYNARHTEHIYIDNQTHFSESSALISFETPSAKETSAYVRVHDTSGGVCQPQCLDKIQETYKDCTGVIKITNNLPLMYYDIDTIRNLQTGQTRQSFLRFYCTN